MDRERIINRWKATAEELHLQLHLGSKELSDRFEDQKKEILNWSEETRAILEREAYTTSKDLRNKLKALEAQADIEKAETKEALQEQRKRLTSLVRASNEASIKLLGDSKKNVRELALKADAKFDEWNTRFDLLRLQINLGAADTAEEWREKKETLNQSIYQMESKLDDLSHEPEEGWSNFRGEISEAWGMLKKPFRRRNKPVIR